MHMHVLFADVLQHSPKKGADAVVSPPPRPARSQASSGTRASGARSWCSAACSSSTASTSRWSASRSRRSARTSTSRPRRCSGSCRATCSATAACCCSAGASPTCSAAGACCSPRSPCSRPRRSSAGSSTTAPCSCATRFLKGAAAAFTAPAEPLDHHDDLRRGPGAQPRAGDLHRLRRQRLLARSRLRRPADRARLALDVPAAGPDRDRAADRGAARARQGRARGGAAARLRLRRRGDDHGGDAAARPDRRRGARGGLGHARDARRAGRWRRCCSRRSSRSSGARPTRSCGSASCARARSCGRTSAWRPCSARYVGLPVRGHAVPAADARLVAGRDGARVPARAACWSRSGRRGSARSSIASAPPGSSSRARSRS